MNHLRIIAFGMTQTFLIALPSAFLVNSCNGQAAYDPVLAEPSCSIAEQVYLDELKPKAEVKRAVEQNEIFHNGNCLLAMEWENGRQMFMLRERGSNLIGVRHKTKDLTEKLTLQLNMENPVPMEGTYIRSPAVDDVLHTDVHFFFARADGSCVKGLLNSPNEGLQEMPTVAPDNCIPTQEFSQWIDFVISAELYNPPR